MATEKPIHTIVLDTGCIIKNEPSSSTLLSQAEELVTVPAIISEIKDAATRARFETTLKPFVTLRSPKPESLKFVTEFARKTGDLAVLSRPDLLIIALTYEIELERNGGDWRLRSTPGQKRMNGPPPGKEAAKVGGEEANGEAKDEQSAEAPESTDLDGKAEVAVAGATESVKEAEAETVSEEKPQQAEDDLATELEGVAITETTPATDEVVDDDTPKIDSAQHSQEDAASDSDSDGWITPSNLKKKQAADASGSTKQAEEQKTMQVAVITTDFAMQNVILQMNLNLLSPSMFRVKRLNTYVLRCHACFGVCKDLTKQFCPRCGQATLTRVACSTSASGEFRLHLKKNMQWNNRGDRYSIPKPVHGSSNGRIRGGGKGGWGNELMLAEDQKEYQAAAREQKRQKERNLMDEDYLPSILTGDRGKSGGRIKVGAGRGVNSKKR